MAAYAIGSLAHGGFAPATSDVDLAIIIERLGNSVAYRVEAVNAAVKLEVSSPLAARLSIFYSSPDELRGGNRVGRLPLVDRIDLHDHGRLLWGREMRREILLPPAEEIHRLLVLEAAQFMLDKLATPERDARLSAPHAVVAQGIREVTKVVLFPVRFLATLETGRPLGNAEAVAQFSRREVGAAGELVIATLGWREAGSLPATEVSTRLLRDGVPPLYRQLVTEYEARVRNWNEPILADQLRKWGERLDHLISEVPKARNKG